MLTSLLTESVKLDKRHLALGRTRKFIPPPWYKGGGGGVDEPPPQAFVMLQYFETIFPSVESL